MTSASTLLTRVETDRRLPIGAEARADETHFRVWAPKRRRVEVVVESPRDTRAPLTPESDGYFSAAVPGIRAGARYHFRLDDEEVLFPDPASRFQPEGPHGPSEVIDPAQYAWTDAHWNGVPREGHVIYELHVGTFTREGTFAAAARELGHLADLGVTLIELMPIADFPGRFGWGYDGVNLFAPCRLYGRPDDLRAFVDRAHHHGLGVILDVVYNHFGPDGNYLKQFAGQYFSDRYVNEWGEALNFEGPDAVPVREFFVANAGYWIDEYHLDGLRLDATQSIHDLTSARHILAEVTARARAAARARTIFVVAENESQRAILVRPQDRGGYGIDAVWNDDFHHTARVALTGSREAYYTDYLGTPQEFVSAAKYGYLYQGQRYTWQKQRRGTAALDLTRDAFVAFLENHDQVANTARGERLHHMTSAAQWRAMTALLLLGPWTPMLFQGQEFSASAPFLYFADHKPPLAADVRRGRAEFLRQFPSLALPDVQQQLDDPSDRSTFERCKLDWAECDRHSHALGLHRDLIRIRRHDPVLRAAAREAMDGAVLSANAFLLRFFGEAGDRLLLVNLGPDLHLDPAPEPLLAPPRGEPWKLLFSSEAIAYGGRGTPEPDTDRGWRIQGQAALLLTGRDDDD